MYKLEIKFLVDNKTFSPVFDTEKERQRVIALFYNSKIEKPTEDGRVKLDLDETTKELCGLIWINFTKSLDPHKLLDFDRNELMLLLASRHFLEFTLVES